MNAAIRGPAVLQEERERETSKADIYFHCNTCLAVRIWHATHKHKYIIMYLSLLVWILASL